jgi:hypothetical protein
MSGPDHLRGGLGGATGGCRSDQPIEIWLRESLANAYDDVLAERLPEDWLALIGDCPKG